MSTQASSNEKPTVSPSGNPAPPADHDGRIDGSESQAPTGAENEQSEGVSALLMRFGLPSHLLGGPSREASPQVQSSPTSPEPGSTPPRLTPSRPTSPPALSTSPSVSQVAPMANQFSLPMPPVRDPRRSSSPPSPTQSYFQAILDDAHPDALSLGMLSFSPRPSPSPDVRDEDEGSDDDGDQTVVEHPIPRIPTPGPSLDEVRLNSAMGPTWDPNSVLPPSPQTFHFQTHSVTLFPLVGPTPADTPTPPPRQPSTPPRSLRQIAEESEPEDSAPAPEPETTDSNVQMNPLRPSRPLHPPPPPPVLLPSGQYMYPLPGASIPLVPAPPVFPSSRYALRSRDNGGAAGSSSAPAPRSPSPALSLLSSQRPTPGPSSARATSLPSVEVEISRDDDAFDPTQHPDDDGEDEVDNAEASPTPPPKKKKVKVAPRRANQLELDTRHRGAGVRTQLERPLLPVERLDSRALDRALHSIQLQPQRIELAMDPRLEKCNNCNLLSAICIPNLVVGLPCLTCRQKKRVKCSHGYSVTQLSVAAASMSTLASTSARNINTVAQRINNTVSIIESSLRVVETARASLASDMSELNTALRSIRNAPDPAAVLSAMGGNPSHAARVQAAATAILDHLGDLSAAQRHDSASGLFNVPRGLVPFHEASASNLPTTDEEVEQLEGELLPFELELLALTDGIPAELSHTDRMWEIYSRARSEESILADFFQPISRLYDPAAPRPTAGSRAEAEVNDGEEDEEGEEDDGAPSPKRSAKAQGKRRQRNEDSDAEEEDKPKKKPKKAPKKKVAKKKSGQ